MKKLLFILAITMASQFTFAQSVPETGKEKPGRGYHQKKMRHHKEMMKQLNLTEDQQKQMKTLRESNKVKRDAIKNDATLTDEQKKEQLKSLRKSQKDQLQSLLNEEQKKKMEEIKMKKKAEKKNHRKMKDGQPSV